MTNMVTPDQTPGWSKTGAKKHLTSKEERKTTHKGMFIVKGN